jgi:hypothetical protein
MDFDVILSLVVYFFLIKGEAAFDLTGEGGGEVSDTGSSSEVAAIAEGVLPLPLASLKASAATIL